jgi:hypothetical protein
MFHQAQANDENNFPNIAQLGGGVEDAADFRFPSSAIQWEGGLLVDWAWAEANNRGSACYGAGKESPALSQR